MLNLLDNAAKWSPPGGTVRVQMRPLDDWSVLLEVADAGPGIADEDLPRVFDRFYRADTSRTMPGSGLGLAIVRQVAVRHGGAVWAGRAPGGRRAAGHAAARPEVADVSRRRRLRGPMGWILGFSVIGTLPGIVRASNTVVGWRTTLPKRM